MDALPVLFLLGSLFLCGHVDASSGIIENMRQAALSYEGDLPCDKIDCDCTFNRQRSCCCAANDMFQLEEDVFKRMKKLHYAVSALKGQVDALTDGVKIAFKATVAPNMTVVVPGSALPCFGPFNTNVPIPYNTVTLNHGGGYNPALGVFTAHYDGVYSFSSTVRSRVPVASRLYHKVQMMFNGKVLASVWEDNRDDHEDSATQVVHLAMKAGDQVYMQLMSGRKLCNEVQYNTFTGYMLYPN